MEFQSRSRVTMVLFTQALSSETNSYGFEHITSSQRYSQSMGFIEKYVQICRNLLKKSFGSINN